MELRCSSRNTCMMFILVVLASATIVFNTTLSNDLAQLIMTRRTRLTDTGTPFNSSIHSILWYDKPVWVPMKAADKSLSNCEFSNCRMTDDATIDLRAHSAIVFTLTQRLDKVPPISSAKRPPDQVWILHYLESSTNVYIHSDVITDAWKNTINWTMTYRRDSDILRPYGRLQRRDKPPTRDYGSIYNRKRKFAAWFVSACGAESARDEYVHELEMHGIPVEIYGRCGKTGHRVERHDLIDMLNSDYKFYLAFENSFCPDYITEKLFGNYNLDIVIVVRGGANYTELLPRGSVIDASDFNSARALADYLIHLNSSKRLYSEQLEAKDKYVALNQDGYAELYSYCKLCKMLNTKSEHVHVYENIVDFVHHNDYSCVAPTDVLYVHVPRFSLMYVAVCVFCIFIYLVCMFLPKGLREKLPKFSRNKIDGSAQNDA